MMEKFHYKVGSGEIVLPRFDQVLTFGVARKMRNATEAETSDLTFDLIEKHASKAALAKLDAMSLTEFSAFMEAWKTGASPAVGESSASSS